MKLSACQRRKEMRGGQVVCYKIVLAEEIVLEAYSRTDQLFAQLKNLQMNRL